jgi:hypothetical protein
MRLPTRALSLTWTLLACSALASAPAFSRSLGEADLVAGPTRCGKADCYEIEITCPEVAEPALATLRLRGPEFSSAEDRGTIYFATGGGGGAFWGESFGKPARRALKKLRKNGFRTVEVRWDTRWLQSAPGVPEGHVRLACRPATAARWIYDNLHPAGSSAPYCATGNSGGSAQVSYMLSHYKLDNILATVVPSSGPPMGRIDLGCLGPQNPDLPNMVYGLGARQVIDRAYGFQSTNGPCSTRRNSFRRELKRNSVASRKLKRYVFPETLIWFVFGEEDIGSAVGQGILFFDRLQEAGTPMLELSIADKTPHAAPSTKTGANKIRDIMLDHCVLRE